ncbi:hypothetical protein UlMin_024266 [Ulmus minor]
MTSEDTQGKKKPYGMQKLVRFGLIWQENKYVVGIEMEHIHLSKLDWKNLIENFNKETSRNYDRKQLKNHWDNVKKDWQLWDALLRGEIGLEASKFWVKGLEHAFKLDEIFQHVTATGAKAWAPSSGLPPFFMQDSTNDDNANATANLDLEEADQEERKQFKKGRKNNSTTTKLSKQLDEIVEVIKNRSSYIRTNPPSCSVQEVLDKSTMLLGCQPMSSLFKLGTTCLQRRQIGRFLLS